MFSGPVLNGPEARPEWKVLEWNRRDCVRNNWGSLAGHFVFGALSSSSTSSALDTLDAHMWWFVRARFPMFSPWEPTPPPPDGGLDTEENPRG